MKQRAFILILAVSALFIWACLAPEMNIPLENRTPAGTGLNPPSYHFPRSWWRNRHSRLVARPEDPYERYFSQGECGSCHVREAFCQACHGYVGVRMKWEVK